MRKIINFILILFLFFLFTLAGCTGFRQVSPQLKQNIGVYVPVADKSDQAFFAPIFLVEENHLSYNSIGRPAAEITESGEERVFIDSEAPAIFVQQFQFTTKNGSYTNFVYRIHFKEVPALHLTRGTNVGLLIIITVNESKEPVLVTTAHTCGCYLSFLPTSLLPKTAFPENWDINGQKVFGEHLPGLLDSTHFSLTESAHRIALAIRGGTHRVMNIQVDNTQNLLTKYDVIDTPLKPMKDLRSLPLGTSTTSFFETDGSRTGYVKGSYKPLERILMSWWSFDLRVGEDKEYYPMKKNGPVFYTSIKYWAREDSDMRNFPRFLKYWGWNL
jgi:hypothetical protein